MSRGLRALALAVLLLAGALSPAPLSSARAAEPGTSRYVPFEDFLVHYLTWGKGDDAVVLVHGFALDAASWRGLVGGLTKSHRVIALDLPGHGDSGKPHDIAYSPDQYARAVLAVMTDAGVKHATLVGHSMGLPVILSVLKRQPQAVDKAVFVAGAIFPEPGTPARAEMDKKLKSLAESLKGSDAKPVLDGFMQPFVAKAAPMVRKDVLTHVRELDPYVAASTLESLAEAKLGGKFSYPIPVLAVYAGAESAGVKDWLAEHFPNNRLLVWDDVDHYPQLERPARLSGEMVKFLGR